ncbi:enoyl-CoA hydratase [Chromatiales bacterium (ex Bugula neritina AB1)]|nr:enoyl-CoA hydratase [Chromatiales bacterium (ex Bugula neritina AB1)]
MSVRIEKEGPVWTVIHSRPEARNAVNAESATALYDAFRDFDADDSASVAVFWGEGGAFCAGWDLKQAATLSGANALDPYDFPEVGDFPEASEPPMAAMGPSRLELSKPVIAAVAGPAVAGGMELALWCDIRVMEDTAFMGVYCRRWGIPLIDGGTVRLPRLVGDGRALDLILTGRQVKADEALKIGLCEYLAPAGESRQQAEALAHQLARFPQSCLRADRRSVRNQHGLSEREALRREWQNSKAEVSKGIDGAARFAGGKGRSGDFNDV